MARTRASLMLELRRRLVGLFIAAGKPEEWAQTLATRSIADQASKLQTNGNIRRALRSLQA